MDNTSQVLLLALPEPGGEGGGKLALNAPLAKFHNWISENSVLTRISKYKMHVLLQGFPMFFLNLCVSPATANDSITKRRVL